MPLKKEEQEKSEGGDELNQTEINEIAAAVKRSLDQDQEKENLTQQIGAVTKDVGEVKGELGKIKEGMHCSKDGKYCFQTPEELQTFMATQKEKVDGIESKVTDIGAKIKEVLDKAKAPPSGLAGLEPLEKMTDQKRDAYTEEQSEERDAQIEPILSRLNISDNDIARKILKSPVNVENLTKKPIVRKPVLDNLSEAEGKQVVAMICRDGKCRPWRQGLEKESGIRIYLKDQKTGKWNWVDEPSEKERLEQERERARKF